MIYILTQESKEDISNFINYWDDKADEIEISYMTFPGNMKLEGFVNNNKIEPKKHRHCFIPDSQLFLRADGSVSVCCNDYDKSLVVGNYKKQAVEEIRSSPENNNVRRALMQIFDFEMLPNVCKTCQVTTGVALENPSIYFLGSKLREFDFNKINALKGMPLVFYGANDILLHFLAKIIIYGDINDYNFVIVDDFKEKIPPPPLSSNTNDMIKYTVHKPVREILSNRHIVIFSINHFDKIRDKLNEMGFSSEYYKPLFCYETQTLQLSYRIKDSVIYAFAKKVFFFWHGLIRKSKIQLYRFVYGLQR